MVKPVKQVKDTPATYEVVINKTLVKKRTVVIIDSTYHSTCSLQQFLTQPLQL